MTLVRQFRRLASRSAAAGLRPEFEESAILRRAALFQRLDWNRLSNDLEGLAQNVERRQSDISLNRFKELLETWKLAQQKTLAWTDAQEKLLSLALLIPNDTSSESLKCGQEPKVIRTAGKALNLSKSKQFHELSEPYNLLKTANIGNFVGSRGYILQGALAELEQALIRFTLDVLRGKGFHLISVPDLLYGHVIEGCGFPVSGDRNMTYQLETEEGEEPVYLSGTAEQGIAAYLSGRGFRPDQLPLKLAAVSRCFRAEASSAEEERGIYRVHNFTKVEMFGLTANETGIESEELQMELVSIQEFLFTTLGLHYQVVEMPANDLGAPAYRKLDIEAWMPGRQQFGEISSCSNCTDYQSRRLNIRYAPAQNFVHTVNGTACAVPRMLIALVETYQDEEGRVNLPPALKTYMHTDWNESVARHKNFHSTFLRTKSQQHKVISVYDAWCV